MRSLTAQLSGLFGDQFAKLDLDTEFGEVRWSDRPDLGQFQCNGALAAAKKYKRKPRDIAESIVEALAGDGRFADLSLAGPGFINIRLQDAFLLSHIEQYNREDDISAEPADGQTMIIDYGGPNIAKPMHVGHLRSAVIGESLKRIARFMGHHVFGDVHLGDWGLQMGLIIREIQYRQPDLPYFQSDHSGPYPEESPVSLNDLENIYPAAKRHADEDESFLMQARAATKKLQDGDPGYLALWGHFIDVSVAALKRDYEHLDIDFDLWLGESHAQPGIPAMLERLEEQGLAVASEGALVLPVSEPNDDKELPPLILRKQDGAVLYGTTDLATIEQRMQAYRPDTILYVVDQRQADHFKQVFRAAYKTGIVAENTSLEHIGFGTVNGKDGKPFKTREGGVMKLSDLLSMVTDKALEKLEEIKMAQEYGETEKKRIAEQVGVAALKFADLMNHRTKNYVFDLDRFVSFEGKTGPYLQYTLVRGRSILRKADERGIAVGKVGGPYSDTERNLYLKIAQFIDAVDVALAQRAPNHLCEYGFQLATEYNRFLHQHHILSETDETKRGALLALTQICVKVLAKVAELLALPVPERM